MNKTNNKKNKVKQNFDKYFYLEICIQNVNKNFLTTFKYKKGYKKQ